MVTVSASLVEGVLWGATVALAGVSLLGLAHTGGLRDLFARVRTPRADRTTAASLVAQPATAAATLPHAELELVAAPTQAPTPTVASAFLAKLAAQEAREPRVQRPFACADWPEPRRFPGYALVGIRNVERGSWN